MKQIDYEKLFWELTSMLEEKVADRLDVNKHHINVTLIGSLAGEHFYDDDDCGETSETFYPFLYRYRKSLKNLEYEDEVLMYWQHVESDEGDYDNVLTEEEFNNLDYWDDEKESE